MGLSNRSWPIAMAILVIGVAACGEPAPRFCIGETCVWSDVIGIDAGVEDTRFELDPSLVDFGIVRVGTRGLKKLRIINSSTSQLSVTIEVPQRPEFSIGETEVLLSASEAKDIWIHFTPLSNGPLSAGCEVRATSQSGATHQRTFTVLGEGGDARLTVQPTVDFSRVPYFATWEFSWTQPLILRNAGSAGTIFFGFNRSPPFQTVTPRNESTEIDEFVIDDASFDAVRDAGLGPGASIALKARLTPTSQGLKKARFQVFASNVASVSGELAGEAVVVLPCGRPRILPARTINAGTVVYPEQKLIPFEIVNDLPLDPVFECFVKDFRFVSGSSAGYRLDAGDSYFSIPSGGGRLSLAATFDSSRVGPDAGLQSAVLRFTRSFPRLLDEDFVVFEVVVQ